MSRDFSEGREGAMRTSVDTLSGRRYFSDSDADIRWVPTCALGFEIQVVMETPCKHPFRKGPPFPPSSQRG